MDDKCIFTKIDVCNMLEISTFTLNNWYRWERKELASESCVKPYLPVPKQDMNAKGKPLKWSMKMVEQLRDYKNNMVMGRNGKYGKYTNACWH